MSGPAVERVDLLDDIRAVEKVEIRPGDVIVVEFDRRLSDEGRRRFGEQMAELFPGVKVMVLEPGMKMSVVANRSNGQG